MTKKAARRGRDGDKHSKNAVGRPRTTISDLHPDWRHMMHALYAGGASDAEVKVALAIPPARALSNDLWEDLQEREPEFSEAIQEGQILAEAWWTRAGRRGLFLPEGVKFNAVTWMFNMTNRFSNYRRNPLAPTSVRAPKEVEEKKVVFYVPDNGRNVG